MPTTIDHSPDELRDDAPEIQFEILPDEPLDDAAAPDQDAPRAFLTDDPDSLTDRDVLAE